MKRRLTILLFLILPTTWCMGQNNDIELTDSTSTEWSGGSGGGLQPQQPTDPVTSLTLSQTKVVLAGGERMRLVATVNQRASNKRIIWTSANANIASVDANGTVMGLTRGKTTITATAAGNTSLHKTCQVTVSGNYDPSSAASYSLPDVPYEFFFNAQNYDETLHCITNQPNANLANASLVLSENLPQKQEDKLCITERCEGFIDGWEKGSYESGDYFYRQGENCLTLVVKVAPRLHTGNTCDFITNRESDYNYMLRIGDNNSLFFHTGIGYQPERALPLSSEKPQILAVRVDGKQNFILLQNLTTGQQLRVENVQWGGGGNVFKLFYNNEEEYFTGDFYWMYCSFEYLTDSQLTSFLTLHPTYNVKLEWPLRKGWNWVSHNLSEGVDPRVVLDENVMEAKSQTKGLVRDAKYGIVGDLTKMLPTEAYKLRVAETGDPCYLSGLLFNASTQAVALKKGWNWMGCPIAEQTDIADAMGNFQPTEGDFMVGQEGSAQYYEQEWIGTLTQMIPGKGYMYKSGKDGQIHFKSASTQPKRLAPKKDSPKMEECPWTCDPYLYPNIMPATLKLSSHGADADVNDYYVAAFCGEECRGVGQVVKNVIMMNIHGEGGETITFRGLNRKDEKVTTFVESTSFTGDILGTFIAPFTLTLGEEVTSISAIQSQSKADVLYNLSGQRIIPGKQGLSKGLYLQPQNGKTKKIWLK